MGAVRVQRLCFMVFPVLAIASLSPLGNYPLAAQANKGAAPAAQSYNVTKEILDHKELSWKPAPATAIPNDVCAMFQVCVGPTKVIALPPATEGGIRVVRGVFWSQDAKKTDVLIFERDSPSDRYYYLLSPQGTLVKTAYAEVTGRSWLSMGNALAQPSFDKEKAAWHAWAGKLGAAAAEKPPESN